MTAEHEGSRGGDLGRDPATEFPYIPLTVGRGTHAEPAENLLWNLEAPSSELCLPILLHHSVDLMEVNEGCLYKKGIDGTS